MMVLSLMMGAYLESIVIFLNIVWYWVKIMPIWGTTLKVLVVKILSFQASSQLKDENNNQMQRELLEKVDISINTTMCVEENVDDKALKETMLEEVQKTKLQVQNIHVNGGDMNREPPSAFAILRMTHQEHSEDWEVVAQLLTLKKLFFLKL